LSEDGLSATLWRGGAVGTAGIEPGGAGGGYVCRFVEDVHGYLAEHLLVLPFRSLVTDAPAMLQDACAVSSVMKSGAKARR